jgi:hypothetical protein
MTNKYAGIEALQFFLQNLKNIFAPKTEVDEIKDAKADWDQTDETALDFIKNKPDEEDALASLVEVGFIEPVSDADGSIYTDENGNIYTLV